MQWTYAVTYLEVIGIIVGQIFVGIVGDGYDALPPSPKPSTDISQVSVVAGV